MHVIVESRINNVINSSVRRERDRSPVHTLRRLRNGKLVPFNDSYECRAMRQIHFSIFSNLSRIRLGLFKAHVYHFNERKKYTVAYLFDERKERENSQVFQSY